MVKKKEIDMVNLENKVMVILSENKRWKREITRPHFWAVYRAFKKVFHKALIEGYKVYCFDLEFNAERKDPPKTVMVEDPFSGEMVKVVFEGGEKRAVAVVNPFTNETEMINFTRKEVDVKVEVKATKAL